MPRARRGEYSLAVVESEMGRMQQALAKLQTEVARLVRVHGRERARRPGEAPKTLAAALAEAEHQHLLEVGQECGWSRSRMARVLEIDRKSLYRRLHAYGLAEAHPAAGGPSPRQVSRRPRTVRGRRA